MTSQQISKEIFYKPATNGKAEQSITEGVELIDEHVKQALIDYQMEIQRGDSGKTDEEIAKWEVEIYLRNK